MRDKVHVVPNGLVGDALTAVYKVLLYPLRARDAMLGSLSLGVVGKEKWLEHRKHHKELDEDDEPQQARGSAQSSKALGVHTPSSPQATGRLC